MAELIDRHMLRPFEWGRADCCSAVCNILRDLGWPDPAAAYRGRYSDRAGAREVMCGSTTDVAVRETARLGWPEIEPEAAGDGDIGVVARSLAIRIDGWWLVKSNDGYMAKRHAKRAWRPT